MANTLPTPFAAIARLADHVLLSKHEQEDFAECEKRHPPTPLPMLACRRAAPNGGLGELDRD